MIVERLLLGRPSVFLHAVVAGFVLLSVSVAEDRKRVNLGRLSIASVYDVSRSRPTDHPYYGALNLFDGGSNWINNLNYHYWNAGGRANGVRVRFSVPVEVKTIVIELTRNKRLTGEHLPTAYTLHTKTALTALFLAHPSHELTNGNNTHSFPESIKTVRELMFTFMGSDSFQVDEIQILGFAPPGTDLTVVRPKVDEDIAKELKAEEEERRKQPKSLGITEEKLIGRAYFRDQRFLFEQLVPIDWVKVARANFRRFELEKPDPEEIRKHYFEPGGSSHLYYEAPLPASLREGSYYLLSENGIFQTRPQGLVGMVVYDTDRERRAVGGPRLYGEISAVVEGQAPQDAGFVIRTKSDEPVKLRKVEIGRNAPLPRAAIDAPGSVTFVDEQQRSWKAKFSQIGEQEKIIAAYLVHVGKARYLFVRWGPTGTDITCAFIYTLFAIGDDMVEAAWNAYGCDV